MGEKGLHDIKNSCAILFRQKRLRELRFQIRPSCKIHQIVPVLDSIAYTPPLANKEHVAYALLELINNSLRAHREKSIPAPISLRIRSTGSALHIEVRDEGGGFDPKSLPYDIFKGDIPDNFNADPFLQYRKFYENKRFGMGLVLARRVFHRFNLQFVDAQGNPRPWGDPSIVGTHIQADWEITPAAKEGVEHV
ncbi:MAG TPA: ATP-binding protein [Spirochaetales bacterium]|nr:ATP-binding protein [Spirochaetales bacterium]